MRRFFLLLLMFLCSCGDGAISSFSVSGISTTGNSFECIQLSTVNSRSLEIRYRVAESVSNNRVSCSVSDGGQGASSFYDSSKTAISDYSCSVQFDLDGTGTGQLSFSVSGATRSATFSKTGSAFDGHVIAISECR